ncbi:MAG: DUF2116 family Zn-ribbon domain-containing protein [Thermoplasmata archaeon]
MDDHRHCKVCGRVCPPSEETCGPACAATRAERLRTRRLYTSIMYILAVVLGFLLLIEILRR